MVLDGSLMGYRLHEGCLLISLTHRRGIDCNWHSAGNRRQAIACTIQLRQRCWDSVSVRQCDSETVRQCDSARDSETERVSVRQCDRARESVVERQTVREGDRG